MADSKRSLIAVIFVVALVAFHHVLARSPVVTPPTRLPHMEGVIDNSQVTNDPVRSICWCGPAGRWRPETPRRPKPCTGRRSPSGPPIPTPIRGSRRASSSSASTKAAQAEYDRALQLDPKSARALFGSGCVAYKQQRYPAARELLEKALAVNERDVECHRALGLVYQATDDRAAAIVHYERAIELATAPGQVDDVRQWLAELKR